MKALLSLLLLIGLAGLQMRLVNLKRPGFNIEALIVVLYIHTMKMAQ